MISLAILVGSKSSGSNMQAIVDACRAGTVHAHVDAVVAPNPDAPALARAQALGTRTMVVPTGEGYAKRLLEAVQDADILCLAGYMTLLPTEVLERFPGRILNIHPALLPKFGGKGMYGKRVHQAVLDAGASESGCSVHIVTEHYDEGPVILQRSCPVLADDSIESLANRVRKLEHLVYPEAIQALIQIIDR